ncbi:MAG: sugar kinase [Reichenbachiella sp.]
MEKAVTLIFDIGKTNKKLFLFDENFVEVYHEYKQFDEITDDEGFPCEDINSLTQWVLDSTKRLLKHDTYAIKAINFSAYGASMVHLDESNKVIVPFYNYLKPFPKDLEDQFFEKYYGQDDFSQITSSPWLGFLNSGMQLYYLKYKKPEVYKQVHRSLHFPQYLSFLFSGKLVSDYTSIGCHTGLWDFRNHRYASWVINEGFEKLLTPTKQSSKVFDVNLEGKTVKVGVGVHDSSSALIPYIQQTDNPFGLISTGTWSISINFFNNGELDKSALDNDCLSFLSVKGLSVKASRLFLGQELKDQVEILESHFKCAPGSYKNVPFDASFVPFGTAKKRLTFKYKYLKSARFGFEEPEETMYNNFFNFEHAYHQLIHELTELQMASLNLSVGNSQLKDIYIDGGFSNNEVFTQMLANKMPHYQIYSTDFALGSALGAALLVNHRRVLNEVIKNNYQLKVHKPMIMDHH